MNLYLVSKGYILYLLRGTNPNISSDTIVVYCEGFLIHCSTTFEESFNISIKLILTEKNLALIFTAGKKVKGELSCE